MSTRSRPSETCESSESDVRNEDAYTPPPLTPEQKLQTASRLFRSAVELKRAYLRSIHPELPEEEIRRRVRDWILYART